MDASQGLSQGRQGPDPELLDGVAAPRQALGHFGETQPFKLSQHDHVAMVLGQLLQRVRQ